MRHREKSKCGYKVPAFYRSLVLEMVSPIHVIVLHLENKKTIRIVLNDLMNLNYQGHVYYKYMNI